jgi:transcriptional regulator with XRE-family HTH domain
VTILIAQNIRKFRTQKGYTLKELAERLSYSENAVSQWELGKRQVSLDALVKLAAIFEASVDELLGVENAQNMEVAPMLVLSTAHVSEETARWLDDQCLAPLPPLVIYDKGGFGWMIPIYDDLLTEVSESPEVPRDLIEVLTFANAHRFTWLMFDRDADQVESLKRFEW